MKTRDDKQMISSVEFECELNMSIHANVEMVIDHITEDDVKETLIKGTKTRNDQGAGDIFNYGVIFVIADNEPCHFYVITTFKQDSKKNSYKDKAYRKRRYMKRKQEAMPCSRCGKDELGYGTYPLEVSGKILGKFNGYQCPNCGLTFYSEEDSRKIRLLFEKMRAEPMSPAELSLILLAATNKPIRGAISFMKEAFLLFKEKLKEYDVPAISPQFIPYHYGPYSFDLVDAWRILEEEGYIKIEGTKASNKESFILTPKGRKVAEKILHQLPDALRKELPSWRRGLDELGNDGILKDVYIKYTDYTDRSKIKNKVLPSGMRGRA